MNEPRQIVVHGRVVIVETRPPKPRDRTEPKDPSGRMVAPRNTATRIR